MVTKLNNLCENQIYDTSSKWTSWTVHKINNDGFCTIGVYNTKDFSQIPTA